MSTRKTRSIVSSLIKKGFVAKKGRSKHVKYTLFVDGKKTSVFTWISHGREEYEDRLLNAMKKELRLESAQEFDDLIDCPMSSEMLVSLLIKRNAIKI